MKILKFNVAKAKRYTDKDGNQKTSWSIVGTYTEFHKDDGTIGRQIEIPAIGLECPIYPPKDVVQPTPKTTQAMTNTTLGVTETIAPEDVAF